MKTSRLIMAVFAIVAAVQLAVPASLILRHELTLRAGAAYKFKTAPVDPYDPFRGRYVALRFEQSTAPVAKGGNFRSGQKAYATIEADKDGFAKFTTVNAVPPADKPYLRVHVQWTDVSMVHLELPFDRFYLEEHLAPKAERAYWENNRRGQTNLATYALVRIRNGTGVIENLFIGDKPIAQFVRDQPDPSNR
jgi:uncharacterized membrane-anchored protein